MTFGMRFGLGCRFCVGDPVPNRILFRYVGLVLAAVFYVAFDTATAAGIPGKQASVSLLRAGTSGASWQLQARNSSLVESLREIERVSGLRIHFSVLPAGQVTATCVADQLSEVLKCLLGNSVNLVFSRSNNSADKVDEVWVLGSSFASSYAPSGCEVPSQNQSVANDEEIVRLLSAVQNADPQRRAEAVFDLAKQPNADPTEIEAILLKSLADNSALVRGQALAGWAQRQGDAALPELQHAMQDTDASVRLQAVELTENIGLLNQALHDPDILIRQLAESKLQALNQ